MEALKDVIVRSSDLLNTIAEVAEDGKFVWTKEIWAFMPQLNNIAKIAGKIPAVKAEMEQGISEEYQAEIINAVKAKLDFEDDKAELIAEQVVKWVIVTVLAVTTIIDELKKKR